MNPKRRELSASISSFGRQRFTEAFARQFHPLSTELEVKFLRVLQSRAFQRLGETTPRLFLCKIAAATPAVGRQRPSRPSSSPVWTERVRSRR